MPINAAKALLNSPILLASLFHVRLWAQTELPFFGPCRDFVSFTQPGFNHDACVYMPRQALVPMDMSTAEAHAALNIWLSDFPYASLGDVANYLAFCLAAYLRLLYEGPSPFFLFVGNSPRTGKDTGVHILHITICGRTFELSWLPTDTDNLKTVVSAALVGQPFIHLSNLTGRLKSPLLERLITQRGLMERILGLPRLYTGIYEPLISASANSDFSMGGDMSSRTLYVRLFCADADPGSRTFARPNVLNWAGSNRLLNLGMFKRFLLDWFDAGCPPPTGNFASFPDFYRIVGGVTQFTLGDPLNLASVSAQADPRVADFAYLLELVNDPNHEDRKDFPGAPWPSSLSPFTGRELRELLKALQKLDPQFLDDFPVSADEFNQKGSAAKRFGGFLNARVGVPSGNLLLEVTNPDDTHTERRRFRIVPTPSGVIRQRLDPDPHNPQNGASA
jgi:hypothetical protein